MPGFFRHTTQVRKTFFGAKSCKSLDIGYHDGKSIHSNDRRQTNIVYAHYHAKPFEIIQAHAKEKLLGRIDDFSEEALVRYRENRGAGHHLVRILLYPDSEAYNESFKDEKYEELSSFIDVMCKYGIRLPFSDFAQVD